MPTLRVFSRHHSHNNLRKAGVKLPVLTVVRFGSTTTGNLPYVVEINKPEGIKNSASKFLMKQCFTKAGVKTADWWTYGDKMFLSKGLHGVDYVTKIENMPMPLVAKHHFGSRGTGNYLLKTHKELEEWMKGKDLSNYIFERYYSYNREYRLHVTAEGCFYTCRKMLKEGAEKRWFRNDSNSVWIKDDNKLFDKPVNWKDIEVECVKALNAVGLDVAAFDVRVQSAKTQEGKALKNTDFIVIESNSAPSFGKVTLEKYIEQIPKIVNFKLKK